MGIPLHRLPGIRRMYGKPRNGDSKIDFDKEEAKLIPGHVIACRITAENTDMAFQPTSGQSQCIQRALSLCVCVCVCVCVFEFQRLHGSTQV